MFLGTYISIDEPSSIFTDKTNEILEWNVDLESNFYHEFILHETRISYYILFYHGSVHNIIIYVITYLLNFPSGIYQNAN